MDQELVQNSLALSYRQRRQNFRLSCYILGSFTNFRKVIISFVISIHMEHHPHWTNFH